MVAYSTMDSASIQAIILGIVQGLTEFLPVSSSAHLLILPWLLGWEAMGVSFDVILHSGTLFAVLIYFRRDWVQLTAALLLRVRGLPSPEPDLLTPLIVGTLPALLVGLFLRNYIELYLRGPWVVVVTLAVVGALLYWADRTGSGKRSWESLGWRHGLIIGLAQALALVPGVSRSGITIVAALLLGFSRTESARFSFLLAVPLLATVTVGKLVEASLEGPGQGLPLVPLLLGVVSSFISGFLCIKYFLRFLQVSSLKPFAVYRLCLSAFLCWWLLV